MQHRLGVRSLFFTSDEAPRSATPVAVENATELVMVDHTKFFYRINQPPALALTLLQILAQRIRNLEKQLTEIY
jgi:CRP-like cAMP-binding protein